MYQYIFMMFLTSIRFLSRGLAGRPAESAEESRFRRLSTHSKQLPDTLKIIA